MSKVYDFNRSLGDRLMRRAATAQKTVAQVNSHIPVGDGVAKVVVTVVGDDAPTAIRKAVTAALNDSAYCIENSFRPVNDTGDVCAYIGFVAANSPSKLYEASANLKVIAKNVLMDETDGSVWDLKTVGDRRVMVRQQSEDLSELLELACVRNVALAAVDQLGTGDSRMAEYVSYVDTASAEVCHGYSMGSNKEITVVLSRTTGEFVQVPNECVVAIADIRHDKTEIATHKGLSRIGQKRPTAVTAAMSVGLDKRYEDYDFSNVDYDNIREYYKALYAYAPAYYEEIEKIIDHYGF